MKKYMKLSTILLSFIALGFQQKSLAFENDLQSICKRPGTNELFIGGEFHTLLVIDANSGSALRQFDVKHNIIDLQFDPAGKHLIVFDGNDIHFLNPDSGEDFKQFSVGHVRLAEGSPYIVARSWFNSELKIYSATDGSVLTSFDPGFDVLDYGYSNNFTEIIILGREMEIKKEGSLITKKIEKIDGYNVYNSAYTSQQDDGKGSGFAVYDMNSKSLKINTIIPYNTSNSFDFNASKYGDHYYVACWEMLLKIDAEGKVTPVESDEATFAYASGSNPSGQYIFISSTKNGYIYNCEDGSQFAFNGREDNEFSYTVDYTFDGNNVYMLSGDFDVVLMNLQGNVQRHIKVERSAGKGFGVYYYNGFFKKEDRDKEATIINKELEALGLPVIDLETNVGDSKVLLAVFGSMDEAEAFDKSINDNGLQYLTKIAPVSEE